MITLDLHVLLELDFLLSSFSLGENNLLLLFLLLLLSNLFLEFFLFLLSQLLKLCEVLNGSVLIVDDIFIGIERSLSLVLQSLQVDPIWISLIGDISLDFLVHLSDHTPDVSFIRRVIVIIVLLQASCGMLNGGEIDARDGIDTI